MNIVALIAGDNLTNEHTGMVFLLFKASKRNFSLISPKKYFSQLSFKF